MWDTDITLEGDFRPLREYHGSRAPSTASSCWYFPGIIWEIRVAQASALPESLLSDCFEYEWNVNKFS